MCGIALLLGSPLAASDRAHFAAMADAISPRGESLERADHGDALLATSRLRIVDRDHAQQPWVDATGRWSLCFNGEIFNHNELRARLLGEGRRFRSSSDTEVVLEANDVIFAKVRTVLHFNKDDLRLSTVFAAVRRSNGDVD